jgi:hypothetical protein
MRGLAVWRSVTPVLIENGGDRGRAIQIIEVIDSFVQSRELQDKEGRLLCILEDK